MRVLHVLASNKYSGAENVVCQIISMFQNDADVEMVYCSPDGQIREALKERNITFIPLKEFNKKELKRVIKEQKPDVVHAHDMRAGFVTARACGNIPLISHIHNNAFDSRGVSLKSIAYMFAAKKAKHIFWVSQSSFDGYAFHRFFKKKSSVLYNVIDIDALYEKMKLDGNNYDYDVIYVGRLTPPKNPHRLMSVFKLLKEKKEDVKIAVVGTGELEDEIKTLAETYGLNDNVRFLGFQSNPLKMLHDSKVMIMTSRWEGTPMCALEAMALGVPIVSTPVDGLKDLVINGENGFLSDDDEKLADNVYSLISNCELHTKMRQRQKQKFNSLDDISKYKKKLKKVYGL